jgi:hypothetical protein
LLILIHGRKIRGEHSRAIQDHQQQLEQLQRTADGNAERTRKRTEAEIADLKNIIRKLEADLEKVILARILC